MSAASPILGRVKRTEGVVVHISPLLPSGWGCGMTQKAPSRTGSEAGAFRNRSQHPASPAARPTLCRRKP